MEKKVSSFSFDILLLVVGILLILFYDRIRLMEYIVMLVGVLFIVPAVAGLISSYYAYKKNKSAKIDGVDNPGGGFTTLLLLSIGALLFGLFLVVRPVVVTSIVTYLFAVLLALGGAYQIWYLYNRSKNYIVPKWLYAFPALILVSGVVILCSSLREIQDVVALITGICFVVFAFNNVLGQSASSRSQQ